jgi:hypothetical protein
MWEYEHPNPRGVEIPITCEARRFFSLGGLGACVTTNSNIPRLKRTPDITVGEKTTCCFDSFRYNTTANAATAEYHKAFWNPEFNEYGGDVGAIQSLSTPALFIDAPPTALLVSISACNHLLVAKFNLAPVSDACGIELLQRIDYQATWNCVVFVLQTLPLFFYDRAHDRKQPIVICTCAFALGRVDLQPTVGSQCAPSVSNSKHIDVLGSCFFAYLTTSHHANI